jgi:hypothetical protein
MELRELIYAYTKEKNLLVGLVMVGLIVSLIAYLLPAKYISTGALIVTRNTQGSDDFFTYEGYYAQEAASLYTPTVEALTDSIDVRKRALDKMGVEATQYNLRRLNRNSKVKRDGNQLIVLEVKDYDEDISTTKWHAVAESLIEVSLAANKRNDPDLSISKISSIPITKKAYRSVWIYLLTGGTGGLFFGLLKVSFNEYFKRS